MSTVYYDNINGFSQLKMENSRLYGRLNSGEWTEIETGGEPGEPGADGLSAYVYIAWCADPSTGAGFSLTTPADYIAFLPTNTQIASPQFGQFSHWAKYIGEDGTNGTDGTSTYVYYAYASDADGTNFSLSPADGLNYQAILVTHTELASPSLADFVGLFYQYRINATSVAPTGTVIAFAGNSAPDGYLICNGAAVSRTTYASLFAVIGTTYGEGDGSTTFTLPNLTDKFIMGSGTAGTVMDAGLPNITGSWIQRAFFGANTDTTFPLDPWRFGAYYRSTENRATNAIPVANVSTAEREHYVLNFDASRSSSLYGNSTTVQPPAVTMRFYIKY